MDKAVSLDTQAQWIAYLLNEERQSQGVSWRDLATATGISRTVLFRALNLETQMVLSHAFLVAQALDVDLIEIAKKAEENLSE